MIHTNPVITVRKGQKYRYIDPVKEKYHNVKTDHLNDTHKPGDHSKEGQNRAPVKEKYHIKKAGPP